MYNVIVKYVWDEKKNAANLRKHGFDFTDAQEAFEAPMVQVLDL